MNVRRRLSYLAGMIALMVAAGTIPAGATGPFGPPKIISNCISGPMAGSIGAHGATRGFIPCTGGIGEGSLTYFRHRPGQPLVTASSPYTGKVLATAWDGTNTLFVVFTQGADLKIAKRTESTGAYSAVTVLDSGPGAGRFTADVVASGGLWWAVWSKQVGPGGEFAQQELFQRHTLLGLQGTTQITHTAANIDDSEPTLGYYAGKVTLIWTRATSPAIPGPSDLRIATTTGRAWSSADLTTAGTNNDRADSVNDHGVTHLTWQRDGLIVAADNSTGSFVSHTFGTPGTNPKIGVSGAKTFLGWTIAGSKLLFAEGSGTTWTSTVLAQFPGVAIAVLGQGGKARVIYSADERSQIVAQR